MPLGLLANRKLRFFWNSPKQIFDLRLAREKVLRLLRNLRWDWLLFHVAFGSCDWFRNQDFFTSSLRSSDGRFQLPVLSPLAGRHSHYVLGHTRSKTYGFLLLVAALQERLCRADARRIRLRMRFKDLICVRARICTKCEKQPVGVVLQWSFPQRGFAYQHTDAHLRIMHAHLAFCHYWCNSSGALCIYNGALMEFSNFWYIDLQEKKVNRCVLVTIPTLCAGGPILQTIANERLSPFCRGHRLLCCNSLPSRWAVMQWSLLQLLLF